MEKHLIYRVSSIIILVSLFGYSLNSQTKPSEEKEKPAVALLRHRSDSATIETMLEAQLVAGSAASFFFQKYKKITRLKFVFRSLISAGFLSFARRLQLA